MMKNEIWRPIPMFPGYEVSNYGRVKSFKITLSGKILKNCLDKKGYHSVYLCRDGKDYGRRVSRLVLLAFIGPCPPDHECCHLDDNKDRNLLSNLMWGTNNQNMLHRDINGKTPKGEKHGMVKLTIEQVKEIKVLCGQKVSQYDIAKKFSVTPNCVSHINTGRKWRWLENPDA